MRKKSWFVPAARPVSTQISVAVGPAGYGATFWRPLGELLPMEIELRAVRLPGRESRYGEPAHEDVAGAVREIVDDILADPPGRPWSLVGVCSGAVIAFEAARELERRELTNPPSRLVVIDRAHPTAQKKFPPLHQATTADLFDRLRTDDVLPVEVASDVSIFALFEAVWRADLQLIEGYAYQSGPRLGCPIVCVATAEQQESRGVARWAEETAASCRVIDVGSWAEALSLAPVEQLAEWFAEALGVGQHQIR